MTALVSGNGPPGPPRVRLLTQLALRLGDGHHAIIERDQGPDQLGIDLWFVFVHLHS